MSAMSKSPSQKFYVIDQYCLGFPRVKEVFDELILPLYGSQERALRLIGQGHDRLCEVMFLDDQPKGLLVYKKELTEKGELELKTLCLIDPKEDSGKGYGSLLHERLKGIAHSRGAEKIVVTVSSEKPESKNFFERKGFKVVLTERDKYKTGQTEYSLVGSSGYVAKTSSSPLKAAPVSASGSVAGGGSAGVALLSRGTPTPPGFAFSMMPASVGGGGSGSAGAGAGAGSGLATTVIPRRVTADGASKKRGRDEAPVEGAGAGREDRSMKAPVTGRDTTEAKDVSNYGPGGHRRAYSAAPQASAYQNDFYRSSSTQSRPPKDHSCSLKDPYVGYIASGAKPFEGRVNTEFFKDYRVGDTVTWFNNRNQVRTKITSRVVYPRGFDEMLTAVGFKKLVPDSRTHAEALAVYNNIPGYADKVRRFGALVFGLEVLKDTPTRHGHYSESGLGR